MIWLIYVIWQIETFKKYKSIEDYQLSVVSQKSNLKYIFNTASIQFEKPLTISQVSFEEKKCVEDHMLMIGDTAGLIHPLCGNGMAMAIHSAKIAADLVIAFVNGEIKQDVLEKKYEEQWNHNFSNRLKMGRILSRILQKEKLSAFMMRIVIVFPFIINHKTHMAKPSNSHNYVSKHKVQNG
jgi:flavin-dependent dehydrogenase